MVDVGPYHHDPRNVRDIYKGMEHDDILACLDTDRQGFGVAMFQIEGDFNFSTVVRTANNFGADEVIYIGPRKKWDKRGAVGTYKYTECRHTELWGHAILGAIGRGYTPVALENGTPYGETLLTEFTWPEKPYIIVGEEKNGLPEELLRTLDSLRWTHGNIVTIPEFGSVRSLNAGTAAGIAMYDFISKKTT